MTFKIRGLLVPRKDAAKVGYDAVLWWEEETPDKKVIGKVVKLLVNLSLYPKMLDVARKLVEVEAELVPDAGATYRVLKMKEVKSDADTE